MPENQPLTPKGLALELFLRCSVAPAVADLERMRGLHGRRTGGAHDDDGLEFFSRKLI
jgi:hypothetical protein